MADSQLGRVLAAIRATKPQVPNPLRVQTLRGGMDHAIGMATD